MSANSASITGALSAGSLSTTGALNAGTTRLGTTSLGTTTFNATDVSFGNNPGRGNGGRAFVHDGNDTLAINYAGDFSGGVRVQSNLVVNNTFSAGAMNIHGEVVNSANAAGLIITCNWNGGSNSVSRLVCGDCGGATDDFNFVCRNGVITAINVLQP